MTSDLNLPRQKRKPVKDAIRLASVILFFVTIAILLQLPYVRNQLFDISVIREQLRDLGFYSYIVFFVCASIVHAAGIPRLWISVVAGSLYGAVQGTGIAMLATLAGSSIDFVVARKMLRGPVLRRMPAKMKPWMERLKDNAFFTILYLRLFPFTNATVTNLLSGASTMRYRDYAAASFLGFIPFTIIFATFGSSAAKDNTRQMIIAGTLLTMVSVAQWVYSRRQKNQLDHESEVSSEDT